MRARPARCAGPAPSSSSASTTPSRAGAARHLGRHERARAPRLLRQRAAGEAGTATSPPDPPAGSAPCEVGVRHVPLLVHATKQILDTWGEDGWELVQVVPGPAAATSSSPTSSARRRERPRPPRARLSSRRRPAGRGVRPGRAAPATSSSPPASCRWSTAQLAAVGKVGALVTPEQAQGPRPHLRAQRAVGHRRAGRPRRRRAVVKVVGFVASAPDFTGQPGVVNGASELLGEVFRRHGRASTPARRSASPPAARRPGRGRAGRRGRAALGLMGGRLTGAAVPARGRPRALADGSARWPRRAAVAPRPRRGHRRAAARRPRAGSRSTCCAGSAAMAFAGGMHVFPGGSVDPADAQPPTAPAGWAGPPPRAVGRGRSAATSRSPGRWSARPCARRSRSPACCSPGPSADELLADVSTDEWEAERVALEAREQSLSELLARRGLRAAHRPAPAARALDHPRGRAQALRHPLLPRRGARRSGLPRGRRRGRPAGTGCGRQDALDAGPADDAADRARCCADLARFDDVAARARRPARRSAGAAACSSSTTPARSSLLLPGDRRPARDARQVTADAAVVLAPNPGPMTLDGTNTWVLRDPGVRRRASSSTPARCTRSTWPRSRARARSRSSCSPTATADHSEGARRFAELTGAPVRALDPAHRLGDEGLAEGDVVAAAGLELRVLATPGHTSDSLSFAAGDGRRC